MICFALAVFTLAGGMVESTSPPPRAQVLRQHAGLYADKSRSEFQEPWKDDMEFSGKTWWVWWLSPVVEFDGFRLGHPSDKGTEFHIFFIFWSSRFSGDKALRWLQPWWLSDGFVWKTFWEMEGSCTSKKPWMSPLLSKGYYLVDGRQLCLHGLSTELGALLSNKNPWECLRFEMYCIPVPSCQSIRMSILFVSGSRFPYEIIYNFLWHSRLGDTPEFLDMIQDDSSLDIRSHPKSVNLW